MDTGKEVISVLLSQIDSITTLGVAVIGGIVALILQLVIQSTDPQKKSLVLVWTSALPLAILFEGIAVLLGYFATGAVTDAVPSLIAANYDATKSLAEHKLEPITLIRYLMVAQFLTFISGIVCVLLVLLGNWRLVRGTLFLILGQRRSTSYGKSGPCIASGSASRQTEESAALSSHGSLKANSPHFERR